MTRQSLGFDNFTLALFGVVLTASLLPVQGALAQVFSALTTVAIAILFFLHGARLSREAILAGASHWRLHLVVFSATFILFPILGVALRPLLQPLITPELYLGVMFICAVPATVQSSIAFTSIARGNIAAAVCSASASSLIGVFLTPVLAGLLLGGEVSGGDPMQAIGKIMLQLLVPFALGHALRPVIGGWVDRHRPVLKFFDQGSILMVVYLAFSEAVRQGLWRQVPGQALAGLLAVSAILLALALLATRTAARVLRFKVEDEITTVFCGSKKSLASGVPMAQVMFPGHAVGVILLPLMIFHQLQLMVCAVLAERYARRRDSF